MVSANLLGLRTQLHGSGSSAPHGKFTELQQLTQAWVGRRSWSKRELESLAE